MSVVDTEDQKDLAEAVRRLVAQQSPISAVRKVIAGPDAYDKALWSRLAGDLGLAGLTVPEEYDGSAGGQATLAVALRELGAGLVPSPLLATSMAAAALLATGDEEARKEWLPKIADGSVVATVALAEPGSDAWAADGVTVSSEGALDGVKVDVLNGAEADLLIVFAAGGLHLVKAGADGLGVERQAGVDPTTSVATVTFAGTPATALAGDATAVLEKVRDLTDLAVAAWSTGATQAAMNMATEYAKIRYSFGQPIGAYQGVKHKLADMYTSWALADASTRIAIEIADAPEGSGGDLTSAASAARELATSGYVLAARNNMLLHGGIGFTWEADAHFYAKNSIAFNVLLGDQAARLERLADALDI